MSKASKLSLEVIQALAEASSRYEGVFTEDGSGIHIFLKHKTGFTVRHTIPSIYLPINERLRNRYIAYQIRQMIIMLDDKIAQMNKLTDGLLPEVAVLGIATGERHYVETIC